MIPKWAFLWTAKLRDWSGNKILDCKLSFIANMMATNCFGSVRPPGLNKETSHGIFFSLAPSNTVCFATLLRSFAHPPLLSFVCWSQISWDVMSLRGFFSVYSVHMLLNISCVALFILHELFFYLWFSRFLVDPKLKPHNLEVPCQGVLLFFSTVGVFSKGA